MACDISIRTCQDTSHRYVSVAVQCMCVEGYQVELSVE
jgi:hypothetical protein